MAGRSDTAGGSASARVLGRVFLQPSVMPEWKTIARTRTARFRVAHLAAMAVPLFLAGADATASPPACDRSPAALYYAADAVVAATVTSSRRWTAGSVTVYLVAKYRVARAFKGAIAPGEIVIVTDRCLDKTIPQHVIGYPGVEGYCLGGYNLTLTGIRTKDGRPLEKPDEAPDWLLFLKADRRPGAPQQTWLEVPRTSFAGGCRLGRDDLPPADRPGFDRALGSRKP